MPFLGNSPQLTFETAIKMPFHTYSKAEQKITTNNPFMSGEMHYQEIETGLVMTVLDLKIKANCNFKAIYDKYFPKEYFLLTFQVNKNPYPTAT